MELLIQSAEDTDFEDVRTFYHALIEAMENAEYKPGWEKDIYPSECQALAWSSIKFLVPAYRTGDSG